MSSDWERSEEEWKQREKELKGSIRVVANKVRRMKPSAVMNARRKEQNRRDSVFKILLKERYPEIYEEIVGALPEKYKVKYTVKNQ